MATGNKPRKEVRSMKVFVAGMVTTLVLEGVAAVVIIMQKISEEVE